MLSDDALLIFFSRENLFPLIDLLETMKIKRYTLFNNEEDKEFCLRWEGRMGEQEYRTIPCNDDVRKKLEESGITKLIRTYLEVSGGMGGHG